MPLFARYRSLIGKYNYTVYFWIDLEIIRAIPQKIGKESYCLLKYWLKCMRASQGIYVNTETLKTKPFSINFKTKYFFHLPVSLFQSTRSFFFKFSENGFVFDILMFFIIMSFLIVVLGS